MNEIKCPHCGQIFKIDEVEFNSIVKQIRDSQFNAELEQRQKELVATKEAETKLTLSEQNKKYNDLLTAKELEITKLKTEASNKEEIIKNKLIKDYNDNLTKKDMEILNLQNQIKLESNKKDLEIEKALSKQEQMISTLNTKIEVDKNTYLIQEKALKDNYETKIKDKDDQISYYRDFKARQSTKMIGESLEVHCNNEFNKLRPLFKNAYFDKDNDAKTGSKGDFIFRDFDDDGTEIVSIMFEMKNEADTTSSKHKNTDFLKELDKDRKEKNCEYAVLVSLLEIDNDLYNNGIVDESYEYPKMYVIRPQSFIPIITLIRGMANNTLEMKKELNLIKNQNIDISNFEENMNNFKDAFGKNYRIANDKFNTAIDEIEKSISHLEKIKDALLSSSRQLQLANNKAEDLSIKKLTHNSKTVAQMFEDIKS